jgi:geranylgeranyl pyrophosphate synthase
MYTHGDSSAKKLLKKNFGNKNVSKAIAEEIKDTMEETGAFNYCKEKVAEYSASSKVSLKSIRDSVFKIYLMRFSDCINGFEG